MLSVHCYFIAFGRDVERSELQQAPPRQAVLRKNTFFPPSFGRHEYIGKYPLAFDVSQCAFKSSDMIDTFPDFERIARQCYATLHIIPLDKENKIVAIGNPIENPNVKKFYLKLLTGKEQETSAVITKVELSTQELDFGTFPKEEQRTGEILFKNVGDKPFVIHDVVTSCGCTKVDYPKTPIPPGGTLKFTITYEADSTDYFRKSLKVYGNMAGSPVKIAVRGETQ